jgi:hypothetical protein
MATRYPNGLETSDMTITNDLTVEGEIIHSSEESLEVKSITTTGDGIIGGTLAVAGAITPAVVVAGSSAKTISVDLSANLALTTAQKTATDIILLMPGAGKILTLGMTAGQNVTITNGATNAIKVKNLSGDTGVDITASKTALYLVTAGEPIKIVETA